jgi:hypothetical protein
VEGTTCQTGVKRTVRRHLGRSGCLIVRQSRCRTILAIWELGSIVARTS